MHSIVIRGWFVNKYLWMSSWATDTDTPKRYIDPSVSSIVYTLDKDDQFVIFQKREKCLYK